MRLPENFSKRGSSRDHLYYSLRATDIYNAGDFITTQFQMLAITENLNQPSAGSGWFLPPKMRSVNCKTE